jgi:ribosomal protein S18 acetylase RimI-like enzyme
MIRIFMDSTGFSGDQSPPIVIHPVQGEDLPGILAVYRQSQDFLALGPDPVASDEMVRQDIEISRCEGGCFCGIFLNDRSSIGVVDFIPNNFEGCTQQAFISLLMIAAPYRRRGLGKQVVRQIETEILKNSRVRAILTAVQINNPHALRFWQKQGYKIDSDPEVQPDTTITCRLRKNIKIQGRR